MTYTIPQWSWTGYAQHAGLLKYTRKGYFNGQKDIKAVCILTGHGLKDPDNAIKSATKPMQVKADMKEIIKAIGL